MQSFDPSTSQCPVFHAGTQSGSPTAPDPEWGAMTTRNTTAHDTRHAAFQRNSGVRTTETEESVTLGRIGSARDRTVSGVSHNNITLSARPTAVKRYNVHSDSLCNWHV